MEAKTQIRLKSLEPYRHLFPPAEAIDKTVKKGANVSDTVSFIPQVVKKCTWQVESFVKQELRGLSTYEACEKLWYFVKHHIEYEKDERGKEQVRSPRRLIHDAKGDCDCFTTFIDTCLYSLGIKGIINRITKYKENHFQHIYPIVPLGNGKYIVMDCVVDRFNYEEPYSEKKDYNMDLQFLDGIPESRGERKSFRVFNSDSGLAELGKLLKRKNSGGGNAPANKKGGIFKKPLFKKKAPEQKKAEKTKRVEKQKKVGKKALKVVNKVNKFNPATALLRAGILASMKLNVMKVAERLKWGYATREFAASKGMDMTKYDKVKAVLAKAEKIFYGAGGKPENLKKAILTGKGNKNREVMAGLDAINEYTTLPVMLGEIYQDEFVNGFEGLGEGLGEPATAASITAASGAMGALAALLATIGGLFKKKEKKEKRESEYSGEESAQSSSEEGGGENQELPEVSTEERPAEPEGADQPAGEEPAEENSENLPATTNDETGVSTGDEDGGETSEGSDPPEETTDGILAGVGMGIKAFWSKHNKWILPVGIGAAVVTGAIILTSSNAEATRPYKQKQYALNGTPPRKKKSKKGGKAKSKHNNKGMIALM